jgi:UDP-N-acetylmuramoyl-L-alanyl-D-glutamate--2,6-diaminopimelate ligase
VAVAVFTNLTQDHLDFHPDMEAYFQAKRLLFASGLTRARIASADDAYGRRLAEEFPDTLTFGLDDVRADYRAVDVRITLGGSSFTLRAPDGQARIECPLPGRFNVANALCALASTVTLGIQLETAVEALHGAERVPGRFEPVDEGQPFAVIVDYAHTPDSLENVLASARTLTDGRLLCVFGCGGNRDREKRPLMGEIAGRLADIAVVTSDNPRNEEPQAIIEEILEGMGEASSQTEVEPDRREAIALALGMARDGDTVVIAGKGHEQGQEFERGRKLPFDDREVAREELHRLVATL